MDYIIETVDRYTEPHRLAIENGYNRFVWKYFDNDRFVEETVVQFGTVIVLYWAVGLAMLVVDRTAKPEFLIRYKVQSPSKSQKIDLKKVFRLVLMNQAMGVVIQILYTAFKMHLNWTQPTVPRLSRFVLEWAGFMVAHEISFYYCHRMFHHRLLYKHVHKQHHEWKAPIMITSAYCHPLEYIMIDMFPVAIGPLFFCSHNLLYYAWTAYSTIYAITIHGGYHFPFFLSPINHDYHHSIGDGNFGILGFIDWFHGTDRSFYRSRWFDQHRMYFSLDRPKSKEDWTQTNGWPGFAGTMANNNNNDNMKYK